MRLKYEPSSEPLMKIEVLLPSEQGTTNEQGAGVAGVAQQEHSAPFHPPKSMSLKYEPASEPQVSHTKDIRHLFISACGIDSAGLHSYLRTP